MGQQLRGLLAWLDGESSFYKEAHANMGGAGTGKSGPCWRSLTVNQDFPGRPTPTRAAPAREIPALVGVARRYNKPFQRGPRQHGRRRHGKIRGLLAWLDGESRLSREAYANTGGAGSGNSGPCWRGLTVKQAFPERPTPTRAACEQIMKGSDA